MSNTLNIDLGRQLIVYTFYRKESEVQLFKQIKDQCHLAKSYMCESQAAHITIGKDYIAFTIPFVDDPYYSKSKLLMANTFSKFGSTVNDYFDVTLTVVES